MHLCRYGLILTIPAFKHYRADGIRERTENIGFGSGFNGDVIYNQPAILKKQMKIG